LSYPLISTHTPIARPHAFCPTPFISICTSIARPHAFCPTPPTAWHSRWSIFATLKRISASRYMLFVLVHVYRNVMHQFCKSKNAHFDVKADILFQICGAYPSCGPQNICVVLRCAFEMSMITNKDLFPCDCQCQSNNVPSLLH